MNANIMSIFEKYITTLGRMPRFGTDEYIKWLDQDNLVQFLRVVSSLDKVILYLSAPNTFFYSVLVPKSLLKIPYINDLDYWNCNPSSSWGITISGGNRPRVFLSPPLDHTGSTILDHGEQIIFARRFEGRQEQQSYIEVTPRLTHSFGLHYVPERNAYCRFDNRGDVEDIIKIEELPLNNADKHGRIVTVQRDVLDEYMVITNQNLLLLFDSTRLDPQKFGAWSNQNVEYRKEEPEISYRMGRSEDIASYLRGFQIIRPKISKKDLVKRYSFGGSNDRKYATFIALDWKHNEVRECSCDPKQLGNYFIESDLPFETSPVFFSPEVLLRYKADSDKYQIQARSISCRHAWHLQTYDLNEAGQVHTYLIYLSYLPYEEQLYWKSFNEPPKGSISRRALKTDFKGVWDLEYEPLQSLVHGLRELHAAQVSWWKLRDDDLIGEVHYPVTNSADEWAKELHALDKLLVEGFVKKNLYSRLTNLGCKIDPQWKSLKLIEEILICLVSDKQDVRGVIKPLKELHFLRSKISGHASGAEAKRIKGEVLKQYETFPAHFRNLCTRCDKGIRKLKSILVPKLDKS